MTNDLLYQVALGLVPHIGDVHAKLLINHYGDAASIFKARKRELESIEGIGTVRANSIKCFSDFTSSEAELKFIEQYNIQPLFITNPFYPQRLLGCYDSPALLYYKGTANLNTERIVGVVGTRHNTDYGKQICEQLIQDLAAENVLIVSGLAYGIDTIAHKAALKNNLSTVGVLAHGLDRLYPPQNKGLAKQMTAQGGLLTEFRSGTNPDKQNFPKRNRIVAGMCDLVLVVETTKKGGSLITAELANGYNKDVFAVPGRTIDVQSEGCNYLINSNKAQLVTSAADILQGMNWQPSAEKKASPQRSLFVELSAEEQTILQLIEKNMPMHIDTLYQHSQLKSSAVAAALLSLEMQQLVVSLPGKMYRPV